MVTNYKHWKCEIGPWKTWLEMTTTCRQYKFKFRQDNKKTRWSNNISVKTLSVTRETAKRKIPCDFLHRCEGLLLQKLHEQFLIGHVPFGFFLERYLLCFFLECEPLVSSRAIANSISFNLTALICSMVFLNATSLPLRASMPSLLVALEPHPR